MDEWVMERYELAKERIAQIPDEKMAEEPYCDFFTKEAMFLQQVIHVMDHGIAGKNLEELQEQNHELYQDILPENYENSYGNPAYAQKMLGEYGKVFTFLYTELHGTIAYAFEKKAWDLTVVLELFLEIYSAFTQEEIPAEKQVKEILVSYVNDYCQDMVENRIREAIDPENNFVVEMIMDSDLSDLSYLYQSGEYVSENELKTAEFMNSLSQREIDEKVELIEDLPEGETISFYSQGEFTDLCAGPHLMTTKPVKAFKLTSLAGAYWRGDEHNKMLQRVYGTAFSKKAELEEYLTMIEEAKKRDHRKLGKELGLFMMREEGPGFPFFLPNGMVLKNTLLDYYNAATDADELNNIFNEISSDLETGFGFPTQTEGYDPGNFYFFGG